MSKLPEFSNCSLVVLTTDSNKETCDKLDEYITKAVINTAVDYKIISKEESCTSVDMRPVQVIALNLSIPDSVHIQCEESPEVILASTNETRNAKCEKSICIPKRSQGA